MMWFQVLMLEGWGEICDMILDAYTPLSIVIFVLALVFGPFTTLKLFLSIIAIELQKMHDQSKWVRAKAVLLKWKNAFLSEALDLWSYNVLLHKILRTDACQLFVLSANNRPMRESFLGWRDLTQCQDGAEDGRLNENGRLTYLRRRNARKLRLALASDAFSMDAQLAFLMASHVRLGRHSAAHVLRSDMRLWIKIVHQTSAMLKADLTRQLFDQDWNSELYLTPGQVQWERLAQIQSRCLTLACDPFEAVQALAFSSAFSTLVAAASLANIVRLYVSPARSRVCVRILFPCVCVCVCVCVCDLRSL